MNDQEIENRAREVVNKFRAAVDAKDHRKKKKGKSAYAAMISGICVLICVSLLVLYLNVSDSPPPEVALHHSARIALDAGRAQNELPPSDVRQHSKPTDVSQKKVSPETVSDKETGKSAPLLAETPADSNQTDSMPPEQSAESAESEAEPAASAEPTESHKTPSSPEPSQTKTEIPNKAAEPKKKGLDGIRIAKIVACQKVENKQYVSPGTEFSIQEGSRPEVWVWMDVRSDKSRLPYLLRHEYYFNEQKYAAVVLDVKYPRMRTWSNITLDHEKYAGDWRVEVVTADKQKITETRFTVIP
ncbi:MAG: DUF2914 domain-containing protein [Desulfobacterales bacterium]|nr:DUF2914 domain-containing protein [Desulfobacterales bacterium]